MGRTLKAKEIYFLRQNPVGNDSLSAWEVLKYKDNSLEETYRIDPEKLCSCPAGGGEKDCRHVKMVQGNYYFTNSKKEPYTISDNIAWRILDDIGKSLQALRWTVFGDLATEKPFINRMDILMSLPDDMMYQGKTWRSGDRVIGFMRVGDVGITVMILFSLNKDFDTLKVKLRKGAMQ